MCSSVCVSVCVCPSVCHWVILRAYTSKHCLCYFLAPVSCLTKESGARRCSVTFWQDSRAFVCRRASWWLTTFPPYQSQMGTLGSLFCRHLSELRRPWESGLYSLGLCLVFMVGWMAGVTPRLTFARLQGIVFYPNKYHSTWYFLICPLPPAIVNVS